MYILSIVKKSAGGPVGTLIAQFLTIYPLSCCIFNCVSVAIRTYVKVSSLGNLVIQIRGLWRCISWRI